MTRALCKHVYLMCMCVFIRTGQYFGLEGQKVFWSMWDVDASFCFLGLPVGLSGKDVFTLRDMKRNKTGMSTAPFFVYCGF